MSLMPSESFGGLARLGDTPLTTLEGAVSTIEVGMAIGGGFVAAVDGELTAWNVKPGEVISRPKARDRPAVLVTEECTHGEQIAGMCALCGKDMTKCVSYPRQSCDDADGAAPSAWITWEYQTPHERRSK